VISVTNIILVLAYLHLLNKAIIDIRLRPRVQSHRPLRGRY